MNIEVTCAAIVVRISLEILDLLFSDVCCCWLRSMSDMQKSQISDTSGTFCVVNPPFAGKHSLDNGKDRNETEDGPATDGANVGRDDGPEPFLDVIMYPNSKWMKGISQEVGRHMWNGWWC